MGDMEWAWEELLVNAHSLTRSLTRSLTLSLTHSRCPSGRCSRWKRRRAALAHSLSLSLLLTHSLSLWQVFQVQETSSEKCTGSGKSRSCTTTYSYR